VGWVDLLGDFVVGSSDSGSDDSDSLVSLDSLALASPSVVSPDPESDCLSLPGLAVGPLFLSPLPPPVACCRPKPLPSSPRSPPPPLVVELLTGIVLGLGLGWGLRLRRLLIGGQRLVLEVEVEVGGIL
jgi:hypothetical protein